MFILYEEDKTMVTRMPDDKPLFMKAAEEFAQKSGRNADAMLADYRQMVLDSQYPGPDCFDPFEVEQIVNGESVSEARLAHLNHCLECAVLIEGATPNADGLETLLKRVRSKAASDEVNKTADDEVSPVVDELVISTATG